MSCTDKINATRKERKSEKEKERRERERKWTEWRVWSLTFGSVDIQSQLSNYKQTTISEAQKKARKTLFFVYRP
jgi:hypothetical protein